MTAVTEVQALECIVFRWTCPRCGNINVMQSPHGDRRHEDRCNNCGGAVLVSVAHYSNGCKTVSSLSSKSGESGAVVIHPVLEIKK